jgi:hypothetical protein
VLQFAAEEADLLSHNYVGTEHLLLGLLREERSVAAQVLAAKGLTIETVRLVVVELLDGGEQPDPQGPPMTPANTYRWPQIPFVPSRTMHILYSGMRPPEQPVISDSTQPPGRSIPRETTATIKIGPNEVVSVQLPQVAASSAFSSRALSLRVRARQLR